MVPIYLLLGCCQVEASRIGSRCHPYRSLSPRAKTQPDNGCLYWIKFPPQESSAVGMLINCQRVVYFGLLYWNWEMFALRIDILQYYRLDIWRSSITRGYAQNNSYKVNTSAILCIHERHPIPHLTVSYGVSFVRSSKKNEHRISRAHCNMYWFWTMYSIYYIHTIQYSCNLSN